MLIGLGNTKISNKGILHDLFLTTISKLNLVTREEFATQTQVLIRTRLRVEELEKKLLELEEKNNQNLVAEI